MPVDAIGTSFGAQNAATTANSSINQEDFIKLFLAQLQFQDPLEPVDNREFLAQLAQFSSLEQSRQISENTENLLSSNSTGQAIGLLNRKVDVQGVANTLTGTVVAVEFTTGGAQLSVKNTSGQVMTGIRLSQISLVQP